MANREHLKKIKEGVDAWNAWRTKNPDIVPNLSKATLRDIDLSGVNLKEANLRQVDFSLANLNEADLAGAKLGLANMSAASLNGADLREADLTWTNFNGAILENANLSGAELGFSIFSDTDLGNVAGLDSVIHYGPSSIGIDTLFRSGDKIPEAFLREAGVPEDFILQIPSLIDGVQPIQFHSSFISYSHQDEEFAQRLHSRMRSANLRVWFAREEMKGGRKLHEQIFSAIQLHDKLLLVLSEHSIVSEWVMTEIRRARKVEREENRRKLFPIRLVDFETIKHWECFDADSGKDLAVELREYYIPDFSNWKDHDAFETEFAKLLRDLRATEA